MTLIALMAVILIPLGVLVFGWPSKPVDDDGYAHECIEVEEP